MNDKSDRGLYLIAALAGIGILIDISKGITIKSELRDIYSVLTTLFYPVGTVIRELLKE